MAAFPYVNGSLFAERLRTAAFDRDMRELLLDCCALDWSRISPAIFGALFQSVMDQQQRRNLGAHYTTEKNILKLIGPLFLDELRAEFEQGQKPAEKAGRVSPAPGPAEIPRPRLRLRQLPGHRLPGIARAGIGYLARLAPGPRPTALDVHSEILCDVDQFYGIEIGGIPGPDRPDRHVADGPPDESAGVRGIRPVFRPPAPAKIRHHRPRQRPATGLAGDRPARGVELHPGQSAVWRARKSRATHRKRTWRRSSPM